MKKKDKNTEEAILQAARKAFMRKGLSGARMQDIADEAGFNKALVHYYFDTKEKLFALIFEQEFAKFFSSLAQVVSSDIPLFDKIERIVMLDLERMSQFPEMPLFVVNEVSRNPAMIVERMKQLPVKDILGLFQQQVNGEVKKGTIINITAEQLLINIQALSIFPFLARPIVKSIFKKTEKDFQVMIEQRKKEVVQFIINAISRRA